MEKAIRNDTVVTVILDSLHIQLQSSILEINYHNLQSLTNIICSMNIE